MHLVRNSYTVAVFMVVYVSIFAECGIPPNNIIFQEDIHYLNPSTKVDPYIFVTIQGKKKKFILDTGANSSLTWEPFTFLKPDKKTRLFHAMHSTEESTLFKANITDSSGRTIPQEIAHIKYSPLAEDGISGLISPQALAGQYPFLIDFKKDCFRIATQIEESQFKEYEVHLGHLHANPYQVMMVPISLNGKEFSIDIDSGSKHTALLSPIIDHFPLTTERLPEKTVDVLGKSATRNSPFRHVNFMLNNLKFDRFLVKGIDNAVDVNEFKMAGHIGMDLLKDCALIVDFKKNRFDLLREQTAATPIQ